MQLSGGTPSDAENINARDHRMEDDHSDDDIAGVTKPHFIDSESGEAFLPEYIKSPAAATGLKVRKCANRRSG